MTSSCVFSRNRQHDYPREVIPTIRIITANQINTRGNVSIKQYTVVQAVTGSCKGVKRVLACAIELRGCLPEQFLGGRMHG